MAASKRILILRLSAMGDVAMAIPVLYPIIEQYPKIQFTVLTRPLFAKIFISKPANLTLLALDPAKELRGIGGLYRLFARLRSMEFDTICDLHDVLRTKSLRTLFRLSIPSVKIAVIDKERSAKRALIRPNTPKNKPLRSNFERYRIPFHQLGLTTDRPFHPFHFDDSSEQTNEQILIGIAPFANHLQKIYPLDQMRKVVAQLAADPQITIELYGGGKQERELLERWAADHQNVKSMVGHLTLEEELHAMSRLHLMVTMDSANMHLASLVGCPVLSIWGATHTSAGFLGWNQPQSRVIDIKLPCRPCSIYGNKPCARGDLACLNQITIETILTRIRNEVKLP